MAAAAPIDNHPAFEARDKRGLWIFKLDQAFSIQTAWTGISFAAHWLTIREDGLLTIAKDYAWDGCSFKRSVLDLFIVGTPDGIVDIRTMKPRTYYASLVHDVLYQYYGYHGISRLAIDKFFQQNLRQGHFALAGVYYRVVRLLGGLGFHKRRLVWQGELVYWQDWLEGRE